MNSDMHPAETTQVRNSRSKVAGEGRGVIAGGRSARFNGDRSARTAQRRQRTVPSGTCSVHQVYGTRKCRDQYADGETAGIICRTAVRPVAYNEK